MKKFEYKIVSLDYDKRYNMKVELEGSEALLTGEGLEGWEAISTFTSPVDLMSGLIHVYVIMKRLIIE